MIVREKESIEYLKECFKVEDGVLLWSETRPESHFIGRNSYKATYFKRMAGNEAGCVKQDGIDIYYRYLKLNSRHYYAHQIIWAIANGKYADLLDHIDGDGLNNCLDNLRESTITLNGRNRKLNSNNSSGNNGVTFSKASNKWQASIWTEGKSVYLGQYETKEEAALVSKQYRDDLGYSRK